MKKIHYTKKYSFDERGEGDFVTPCGIRSVKHKHFINAIILETRVTCKKCNKAILKKEKP